jgi:hypothetical protein
MTSKATTVEEYLRELPEERREVIKSIHETLLTHLPQGYVSGMSYGMISYHVPHELYPAGYHCDPKQPLPFISLAAQKNNYALYHMGIYAQPQLLDWFTQEYKARVKTKLDMGKSCIRFKSIDALPLPLIASLASKMTVEDWVSLYETNIKK